MSIQSYYRRLKPAYNIPWSRRGQLLDRKIERCPYCQSRGVVRRGRRQTKHESIQLYLCKDCHKTFNPRILKSKQYPFAPFHTCDERYLLLIYTKAFGNRFMIATTYLIIRFNFWQLRYWQDLIHEEDDF